MEKIEVGERYKHFNFPARTFGQVPLLWHHLAPILYLNQIKPLMVIKYFPTLNHQKEIAQFSMFECVTNQLTQSFGLGPGNGFSWHTRKDHNTTLMGSLTMKVTFIQEAKISILRLQSEIVVSKSV